MRQLGGTPRLNSGADVRGTWNRAPILQGLSAPWQRGQIGGNRATQSPGVTARWNDWARATTINRVGVGAARYGWNFQNNVWVNNNYWYRNYGYRWYHGYWPWWWRVGFWPGWWFWARYGYGYPYGYGYAYDNPYYLAAPYGPVYYDYSQPLPAAPTDPYAANATDAQAHFDNARAAFKQGDFATALAEVDAAIALAPSDTSMHEFRALFALQRFDEAAETIYPVLAAGPGWNWDTMWSLYPSAEVYRLC